MNKLAIIHAARRGVAVKFIEAIPARTSLAPKLLRGYVIILSVTKSFNKQKKTYFIQWKPKSNGIYSSAVSVNISVWAADGKNGNGVRCLGKH